MTVDVGFIAYPGTPSELSSVIREATKLANAEAGPVFYETWEHSDIAGKPLTTPILSSIGTAKLLVADVTRLNFNVSYEIGYAIGIKKRVLLIRSVDELLLGQAIVTQYHDGLSESTITKKGEIH